MMPAVAVAPAAVAQARPRWIWRTCYRRGAGSMREPGGRRRWSTPEFLTVAGWNPARLVFAPPAGHRLLGRPICRAAGLRHDGPGRACPCVVGSPVRRESMGGERPELTGRGDRKGRRRSSGWPPRTGRGAHPTAMQPLRPSPPVAGRAPRAVEARSRSGRGCGGRRLPGRRGRGRSGAGRCAAGRGPVARRRGGGAGAHGGGR